ncbi:Sugar/inositol transporter [Macleaya cordata]|uniref:Sugar/inositol transporter n=1 Tax=Macleaya cordata TaxID=56857 RepID=A0A200QXH3_MACCD|nr:Sugar/inositol transporter [Macleaya cordata]
MVNGRFRDEFIANFRLFGEYSRMAWQHPYILRLTFSAGIGALLVGYFTGVISIACFYAHDDFQSVLHESIVSMAIVGGIFGAAVGGWMNDSLGRKSSLLIADVLIFVGATLMAISSWPSSMVLGTVLVGFGVGIASMTAPIYISEASPVRIRGVLVSTNGLLIAIGQFLSYGINLGFTKTPRTWPLMLGVVGFPAVVQFILLLTVPESPNWLYIKRENALKGSDSILSKIRSAWSTPIVRRGLVAGIVLQVVQQLVGINTVMYYIPNILELAGNKTLLSASLISYSYDIISSWIMYFASVDKYGRRKPVLYSMCGIVACFFGLTVMFKLAADNSPTVSRFEAIFNFGNNTCSTYKTALDAASWNCMTCLQASSGCGFCAIEGDMLKPGACLTADPSGEGQASCLSEGGKWFMRACPHERYGSWALTILALYIRLYSIALGTVPIIVNSDIYPLKHRGICGGMAAVANWLSYLILISFVSFTKALGSAYTFLLLWLVSCLALAFIDLFVPETKGLPLDPYVDGWLRKLAGSLTS